MSEKFCLKWNDFKENTIGAFGNLRGKREFADVTLACENGEQVEAHKVVLAASSPFFQNLLRRNKHAHPLIYMRGIKMDDLLAILDFLYFGEANVFETNLDEFLALAEELEITGLMGKSVADEDIEKGQVSKKWKPLLKKEDDVLNSGDAPNSNVDDEQTKEQGTNVADGTLALTSHFFSGDLKDLDKKCNSMMERTLRRKENGQSLYKCKVCGKEEICGGLKHHIEANHLQGISIPCNFCEKTFGSRNSLANHIHASHKAFRQGLKQLKNMEHQ